MFEKIEAAAWPDAIMDKPELKEAAKSAYEATHRMLANHEPGVCGATMRGILAAMVEFSLNDWFKCHPDLSADSAEIERRMILAKQKTEEILVHAVQVASRAAWS